MAKEAYHLVSVRSQVQSLAAARLPINSQRCVPSRRLRSRRRPPLHTCLCGIRASAKRLPCKFLSGFSLSSADSRSRRSAVLLALFCEGSLTVAQHTYIATPHRLLSCGPLLNISTSASPPYEFPPSPAAAGASHSERQVPICC